MDIEEIKKKKIEALMKKMNYPKEPIVLTDDALDKTAKKYPLVIVDCWAEWCAPCKIIAPMIENLAKKYQGKIVFGKMDMNENRLTAIKFKINAIPCLLVFKNGKLIDKIIGAMPEPILESKIKKYL